MHALIVRCWFYCQKLLIYPIIVIHFFSCDKSDTNVQISDGAGFMPLQVGQYLIYDVRQEIYSAGRDLPETSNWQEKDQVTASETSDNTTEILVARFRRNSDTGNWVKIKDYRVQRFPDKILTTLDNQTFWSMALPIDGIVTWNGNNYNSLDEEKYHYEGIGTPQKIVDMSFDKTISVVERADSSVINKFLGVKKYALGVGLIFDEQINLQYCQTQECLESDFRKIESGSRVLRTIEQIGEID